MAQNPNIEFLKTITPLRDVEKFYLNAATADVYFVCSSMDGDGEPIKIPAHKLILASVSRIYYAMFYGPIKVEDNLAVTNYSSDVVIEFLKLFYLKNPTFSTEHVNDVVYLAKMYHCFAKETSTKSLETMKTGTVDQSTSVSLPDNENSVAVGDNPAASDELIKKKLNFQTHMENHPSQIFKLLKDQNDAKKNNQNDPIDEDLAVCSKTMPPDNRKIEKCAVDPLVSVSDIEDSEKSGDDPSEVSQTIEEMRINLDNLYFGHEDISKSSRIHWKRNTNITEPMKDSESKKDDRCEPIDEVMAKENLGECSKWMSSDTLYTTEMFVEDNIIWEYDQEWQFSPTESLAKYFPNQYVNYSSSVTTTIFSSTKSQNLHRIFFQRATDHSGKRDEIPVKIQIYSLNAVDKKLFIGNVILENSRVTVLEFKEPIPIAPNQQYCIIAYMPNSICFLSYTPGREPIARKNDDVKIKFYANAMHCLLTGESITIQPNRGIATRLDFVEEGEPVFREPPHSLNDFDVLHVDLYAHYLV